MPAPGFTAELTLYRSGDRRAGITMPAQAEGNSVTPATWKELVRFLTFGPIDLLGDTACRAKCWGAGAAGAALCPTSGPGVLPCLGAVGAAASICSDAC
jgi:hypothetical protein